MKFEDLENSWRQQKKEKDMYTQDDLLKIINTQMSAFDSKIQSRDHLEIAAVALIVIIFGILFFTVQSWWMKLGCWTLVFSGICIAFKLYTTQKQENGNQLSFNKSLRKQLHDELDKVQRQKKLLKNVFWWYLLPIFTGLVFFTIGLNVAVTLKIVYLAIMTVVYAWIWKMNQAEAHNKFDPIIRNINEAIRFIK